MLISSVVIGQTNDSPLDIKQNDYYFEIKDTDALTGEFLFTHEFLENKLKIVNNIIGSNGNGNGNGNENGLNNLLSFGYDLNKIPTSTGFYTQLPLNTNSVKWILSFFDNDYYIQNYGNQSFLRNGNNNARNLSYSPVFNNVQIYKWNISHNAIFGKESNRFLAYNDNKFSLNKNTNDPSNLKLYKRLRLENFENIIVYTGTFKLFDLKSETNGDIVYSLEGNINNLAYFEENMPNKLHFTNPGEILLKAKVLENGHIPSYTKTIKITIVDNQSCFEDNFSNHTEGDYTNWQDNYKFTNTSSPNFIQTGGYVYQIPYGIRIGNKSGKNNNGSETIDNNNQAYVITKKLNNVEATGDKKIIVELDIKGPDDRINHRFRIGFGNISNGVFNYTQYKDILITNTFHEDPITVSAEFQNVTAGQYFKISTELVGDRTGNGYISGNARILLYGIRLNCTLPDETIWRKEEGASDADWTAGPPNINRNAIIEYPINENVIAKNLTINYNLTVPKGIYFRVAENLNILDGKDLTFKKGSYLFLSEYLSEANPGSVINKEIKFETELNYHRFDTRVFSSPMQYYALNTFNEPIYQTVSGNIFNGSFTNNDVRLFNHDPQIGTWGGYNDNIFVPGIGIGIQRTTGNRYVDESTPRINRTDYFIGIPNNKTFNYELLPQIPGGTYSLGNPFPAPLNIESFLYSNDQIDQIEVWREDNPWIASLGRYKYLSYWIVCTRAGCNLNDENNHLREFTQRKIDVGMGFVAKLNLNPSSYTVNFNHSDQAFDLIDIFQNNKLQSEKSRFIISLEKDDEIYNSVLLGYINGAENIYDSKYDAIARLGEYNSLMINNNDLNLSIDAREYPLNIDDSVILTYKAVESGNYVLNLRSFDGEFEYNDIYLKDNLINKLINLKELKSYEFYTETGLFNNRFEIFYKNNLNTINFNEDQFNVYKSNGSFVVESKNKIDSYSLYDISGKLIFTKNNIGNNKFLLEDSLLKGHYILYVKEENGVVKSKKIIL